MNQRMENDVHINQSGKQIRIGPTKVRLDLGGDLTFWENHCVKPEHKTDVVEVDEDHYKNASQKISLFEFRVLSRVCPLQ